jgi:DNA end-binding protein Ku
VARALWKGAITFGLVHVPVELYPAEERKGFKFSMLDKRDFSPVGYKRYSKETGKEVPWSDVIKGYEYEKDQYVVLSDEDFRRANVNASQTIEIESFVPVGQIAPEYFETPYYLAPSGRGEKVYALLRETLRATGRVAIGQVVIRTAEHLAAVYPDGRALMLNTLRYADELRDAKGLELPEAGAKAAKVSAKELDLAKRLVDDMAEDWDAAKFKDTYHQDLMRRIEEKIKNGETREITEPDKSNAAQRRSAKVVDLAALLRQSLRKGTPGQDSEREDNGKPRVRKRPDLRVVSSRGHPRAPAKASAKRKRA